MPLLETLLRMANRGGQFKDDFNRTVAANGLGSMSQGGLPWTVLSGSWSVNGTRPVTSTAQSSNPIAVIKPGTPNVDLTLSVGAGDALYFRVQDASNWYRMLWYGYQSSSCQTCCSTCCSSCCSTCSSYFRLCGFGGSCTSYISDCSSCGSTCVCSCADFNGYDPNGKATTTTYTCVGCSARTCTYDCNCTSCNCTSCNCSSCNCTYYNNYYATLQKMTAGTLSTIASSPANQGATGKVRIVGQQDTVTAFYGGASPSTQLYTGAQSGFNTANQHGIGRGSSSYDASSLDDFIISY